MRLDGKNEFKEMSDTIVGLMDEIFNERQETKAGFNPHQPRDKDGQWSKTGWHGVDYDELLSAHNEFGGSSFDLDGNNLIGRKNSFSVGVFEDKSLALPKGTGLTKEILEKYYEKYKDILLSTDDLIIGSWVDENGIHWIDITKIVVGLEEAKSQKSLGIAHNQISIFDLENVIEIKTGGTGYGKK